MLKQTKVIDQDQTDLITGYFRRIKRIIDIDDNNPYYDAPELVVYVTVLYHWIQEFFTVCAEGKMKISDAKDTVDTIGLSGSATVYGNVAIDGSILAKYIWEFKVIYRTPVYTITTIGIDASNKGKIHQYFYNVSDDHYFYAYKTTQYAGYKYENAENNMFGTDYGKGRGDDNLTVKMELDTKERTIKFYHDEQDLGIAFDNLKFNGDIIYHLAVYIQETETSVQLSNFHHEIY